VAGYVLDVLGTKGGYAMFAILWALVCMGTALANSWGGLAVARGALAEYGDRIRILQADLADPACFSALSGPAPQAAVSSTALHWLMPEQQLALYRNVAGLLADGGVFLNADHQRYDQRQPRLKALAERHDEQTQQRAWANGVEDWDRGLAGALQSPALAAYQAEREALSAGRPVPPPTPVD
ncbi:MFS transporter, partial [Bacillus cereus]|nr:MFS transporter [Bacillus cereus]